MRAHNWTSTGIGSLESWPQSLRTAVRLLLNTRHPMYIWWGPDLLCFYNDAYSQSIGPERHPSSLGQPGRSVWDEIWPIIGPEIDQVMSGGGATWHENTLIPITRNGRREDVYWTYSYGPIDDESAPNGVGGVLVVCTETTAQINVARQLAKSEERLQLALSAGRGVGTWDWDVQKDLVVADERFARLYGVDPEKAKTGAPIAEFFTAMHVDDQLVVQEKVAEAMRTGEEYRAEYRLVQSDGSVRWVTAEGRCTLDPDGTPRRFPGVTFDITERKDAEERLRELNADLERRINERARERSRTWDLSPDLLGVLNDQGFFESTNPAWQTTLGWSADYIAKTVFFDFLHPDDLDGNHIAFEAALQGQPVIRFENRYRHQDGSYRWLSWVAIPEGDKIYCSARDVTPEKAAEAELITAQEALRRSQKMEAVGQLTGGLAHDFNNLLTGIGGSFEMLQSRLAQGRMEAVDRYIVAGQGAVKRAAAVTHRLLAFSRRQTLDPKPTDVNRLVIDIEDLVRRTVGPSVHVEVVSADGLWPTLVDPNQLENALLNLCINARDAMPDGGRLTIETANKGLDGREAKERDLPPGLYVSLQVTDTGTGMSPDIAAKAFDPFFTTKPFGQGTGLGLSMIYGFARQSGGQVGIFSEVGAGTTMSLYLPRYDREVDLESVTKTKLPQHDAVDGEVVLIIDDEPTIRMLIAEVLGDAGYVALEATDGPSGLRMLQSAQRIDLLITDVGLPGGLNGRQIADAARVSRPALKVLFITGYAETAAIGDGHLDPGMHVVTKPFSIDDLARKIQEIIES